MSIITSVSNPAVKAARALKAHKARMEASLHLAEGPKALYELIESGVAIDTVFCEEAFALEHAGALLSAGANTITVSRNVLEALSDTRAPQGAVIVVKTPSPGPPSLEHGGLVLALDGVQDPGNMGTLIRAADAFGARAVLLGIGCAEPFSPKAVRACAFSCYHLPIFSNLNLASELKSYSDAGYTLLAADVRGHEGFPPLQNGVVIVVGSEGQGPKADVLALCERVRLEMRGRAESLNVALAAGIFLYEVSNRIG